MSSSGAYSVYPFPLKLHYVLDIVEAEGLQEIVSWQPHGKAFRVHKTSLFVELILKRFFNQSKYPSFQRQLNLYGFSRFSDGPDKGAYYHTKFVRGQKRLSEGMTRQQIKGNGCRRTIPYQEQPNFYEGSVGGQEDTANKPPAVVSPSSSPLRSSSRALFPAPLAASSKARLVSESNEGKTAPWLPADSLMDMMVKAALQTKPYVGQPPNSSHLFGILEEVKVLLSDDSELEEIPLSNIWDETMFDNISPETIDSVFD